MPRAFAIATLFVPFLVVAPTAVKAASRKAPCKPTLNDCPAEGCGQNIDKVLNRLKNRTDMPQGAAVEDWTVTQVIALNEETPEKWKRNSQRGPLEEIGEGTPVRVKGWLIEAFITKTPEACNCFLRKKEENDIHVNLTARKPGHPEEAMVVEITPRFRKPAWTADKLAALVDQDPVYVRVTGWLVLDSMHVANTPHATAWEVHPVTGFEVCQKTKQECDQNAGGAWAALEDLP